MKPLNAADVIWQSRLADARKSRDTAVEDVRRAVERASQELTPSAWANLAHYVTEAATASAHCNTLEQADAILQSQR